MATATMERKKKVKEKPPVKPAAEKLPTAGGLTLATQSEVIRVDRLERHPDNRVPKQEAIEARARSIQEQGQIDPILVRRRDGHERYQILSGETRWRAHQLLGAALISARVVECSDREALEYLAASNTERTDLTTSDRARLAAAMCAAGFKRDEVAPRVGVTSGSAVSNLIKLLDAPACWLKALDEGVIWRKEEKTIHEGTVREVAKFREVPELAEKMLDEFLDVHWFPYRREEQIGRVWEVAKQLTRSLSSPRWYGKIGNVEVYADHKPRFKIDDETRERLRVVTIPTEDGASDEVALNVEEFDRLQLEALAKLIAKRKGDERATGGEVTDADRAKEQAAKLREWAAQWRICLLRVGLAEVIDVDTAPLMFGWLATALASDRHIGLSGCIYEAAAHVAGLNSESAARTSRSTTEALLAAAKAVRNGSHDTAAGLVLRRACQRALWPAGDDDKPPEALPFLDGGDVEAWAGEHGVTVEGQWEKGRNPGRQRELILGLISRHTTIQLRDLCEVQGIDVGATAGKAELVAKVIEYHGSTGLEVPAVVEVSGKGRKKRK